MKLSAAVLALCAAVGTSDLYMHAPRGGNNRNRERNDNRNNANRLFDSQNNGKGGYAWAGVAWDSDKSKIGSNPDHGDPDGNFAFTYYAGERLAVEYTCQHGSGEQKKSNVQSQIILQMLASENTFNLDDAESLRTDNEVCPEGVQARYRDGYPTSPNTPLDSDPDKAPSTDEFQSYKLQAFQYNTNKQQVGATGKQKTPGTDRIPDVGEGKFKELLGEDPSISDIMKFYSATNGDGSSPPAQGSPEQKGLEYGMHENQWNWDLGKWTQRNHGLYTSDQKLKGHSARYTRQNPNGGRYGMEIAEERDYYPYWRATNWIDLAVLTSDKNHCPYYQTHSQNVERRWQCDCGSPWADEPYKFCDLSRTPFVLDPEDPEGKKLKKFFTNTIPITQEWCEWVIKPEYVPDWWPEEKKQMSQEIDLVKSNQMAQTTNYKDKKQIDFYNDFINIKSNTPERPPTVRRLEKFVHCERPKSWGYFQVPSWGLSTPRCEVASLSRDNHLGNADNNPLYAGDEFDSPEIRRGPITATLQLTVPAFDLLFPGAPETQCIGETVFRMRYNMSTGDYAAYPNVDAEYFDSTKNCPRIISLAADDNTDPDSNAAEIEANPQCVSRLTTDSRPLYNRPYVDVLGDMDKIPRLSLAINTHQTSRTFQDRSYVIRIKRMTDACAGDYMDCNKIISLALRGKRGNIVQAYPAVEYDFTPTNLKVEVGDCIHYQLHLSDFNTARNPNNGEGWQYSDAANLVEAYPAWNEMDSMAQTSNYPRPIKDCKFFKDDEEAQAFALSGQKMKIHEQGIGYGGASTSGGQEYGHCDLGIKNYDKNEDNNPKNCGKLNMRPNHFERKIMITPDKTGQHEFISTRNNNFSNRSQKCRILVKNAPLSRSEIAAFTLSAGGAVAVAALGAWIYTRKNPNSGLARMFKKRRTHAPLASTGV